MMKPMMITLSLFGLLLCGTGCVRTALDCPAGKGLGCRSIAQVDQHLSAQANRQASIKPLPKIDQTTKLSPSSTTHPKWVPAEFMQLWFPPYQDEHGWLHSATELVAPLHSGHWQWGSPDVG